MNETYNYDSNKGGSMKTTKENKFINVTAKGMVHILDAILHNDANSTSCAFIYQPKQPEELSRFRKTK